MQGRPPRRVPIPDFHEHRVCPGGPVWTPDPEHPGGWLVRVDEDSGPGIKIYPMGGNDKIGWQGDAQGRNAEVAAFKYARIVEDAGARFDKFRDVRPPTSVVCVKGLMPVDMGDTGIVYVGRAVYARDGLGAGIPRFAAHPLGNPVKVNPKAGAAARVEAVRCYREYLRARPHLIDAARALRGRKLGCWCGHWDGVGFPAFQCHAVEIARVAETRPGDDLSSE